MLWSLTMQLHEGGIITTTPTELTPDPGGRYTVPGTNISVSSPGWHKGSARSPVSDRPVLDADDEVLAFVFKTREECVSLLFGLQVGMHHGRREK